METEIEVRYDQLISSPRYDNEGNEVARIEHHHFTFGKIGSIISGGFYIKRGEEIPEKLILTIKEDLVNVK
jgi:hypothetical protein